MDSKVFNQSLYKFASIYRVINGSSPSCILEQEYSRVNVPMVPLEKCQRSYHDGAKSEIEESSISDFDLDNIVGIADGSELQVFFKASFCLFYGI